jgi:glutamyl-tRNA reductase
MRAASGPSRLLVVGTSHRTSGAALRDRLFVDADAQPDFLDRLRDAGISNAVLLATCDRVEVQAVHEDQDVACQIILELLSSHSGVPLRELEQQCYRLDGRTAMTHLFSVAAALDSLVVGEPQVLGQVKDSHRLAQSRSMINAELGGILAAAYHAAKRVRTETTIGQRPVSIAAAAERLARNIHGDLDGCAALLVGAGEMGELIADHLRRSGLSRITVVARIAAQAEGLAQRIGGHHAAYDDLQACLPGADIVITAVATGQHVITREYIATALAERKRRPIFLIDTGVPGDIQPAVNDLDDAFVYDLADLEAVALEGLAGRDAETKSAVAVVEEEVARYFAEQAGREISPLISALREHFHTVRRDVLDDEPEDAAAATRLLINRLLHSPSDVLRDMSRNRSDELTGAEGLLEKLFGVKPSEGGEEEKDQ